MPECVWVLMCECVYLCVRTCLCLVVNEKKESKRAHFWMDIFCYHRILSNALITSSAKGIESFSDLYSGSSKSNTETNIYSKNFFLGK